jgi:cysteinyl-tRNA synthetase
VANRLQSRQRSGVSWAFRSWLAEITRVRDKQLRKSSTLVWDRHEKAREGLLGRVAENLARVTNAKSTRACFSGWSALVKDSGSARWQQQLCSYAARRLQRWKITMAFRRWETSATGSKWSAAASNSVAQQQAAAESRELLARAQERLEQMEQRAHDAEEAAAAAEHNEAAQQEKIRKLQKRLKRLTLANSEQGDSLRRELAQREISLHR